MSRELDEQVAEVMGFELMGWENAEPDPEIPGEWSVYPFGREKQPTYLKRCNCDLIDECADSCDLEPLACGHIHWCLEVVPFYSEDIAAAWIVFQYAYKHGVHMHIFTEGEGEFSVSARVPYCDCGNTEELGYELVRSIDKIPEAICRAFLAAKETQ